MYIRPLYCTAGKAGVSCTLSRIAPTTSFPSSFPFASRAWRRWRRAEPWLRGRRRRRRRGEQQQQADVSACVQLWVYYSAVQSVGVVAVAAAAGADAAAVIVAAAATAAAARKNGRSIDRPSSEHGQSGASTAPETWARGGSSGCRSKSRLTKGAGQKVGDGRDQEEEEEDPKVHDARTPLRDLPFPRLHGNPTCRARLTRVT